MQEVGVKEEDVLGYQGEGTFLVYLEESSRQIAATFWGNKLGPQSAHD